MIRVVLNRRVEDFELHKELYRGKTSLLYMATDRISGMQVALKLYRKRKLSILNRCGTHGEYTSTILEAHAAKCSALSQGGPRRSTAVHGGRFHL